MSTLSVTENWADGTALTAAHLSTAMTSIETVVNGNLDADNLATSAVTEGKIATGAVTEAKLGTGAVTTAKVGDLAVTAGKLAADSVITAKILDSNVTTAKINDGAVTQAKRAALGHQLSSSCGAFSSTSTSYVDVTNLSVTITTTGRPVRLMLVDDEGAASTSQVIAPGGGSTLSWRVVKDGTALTNDMQLAAIGGSIYYPPSAFGHVTVPSAGSYTYKIQMKVDAGTGYFSRMKLLAFEL